MSLCRIEGNHSPGKRLDLSRKNFNRKLGKKRRKPQLVINIQPRDSKWEIYIIEESGNTQK